MFKSIIYLRNDKIKTNSYIYKLIDTDFECEVASDASAPSAAAAIILEYKKRNYSHDEIVKNLFRCNLYLCDEYNLSFEKELFYQNKYFNKYFKDINFSKLYYQDLKDMWDKHKAFV